jgi:putative transposase
MNPTPLQYGHYYHIYNRGNNRENIFIEERNYRYFLQLYLKYIEPIAWTFAYCLLRNHFHFLVRIKDLTNDPALRAGRWAKETETYRDCGGPPDTSRNNSNPSSRMTGLIELPNPSRQFSHFFNSYTRTINQTYHHTGALFQRPFGRKPVTTDAYFTRLIVYIHQNPQKHGFVDDFQDWPYSSYHTLLSDKPTHLRRDTVLSWFGGPQDVAALHLPEMRDSEILALAPEDFD